MPRWLQAPDQKEIEHADSRARASPKGLPRLKTLKPLNWVALWRGGYQKEKEYYDEASGIVVVQCPDQRRRYAISEIAAAAGTTQEAIIATIKDAQRNNLFLGEAIEAAHQPNWYRARPIAAKERREKLVARGVVPKLHKQKAPHRAMGKGKKTDAAAGYDPGPYTYRDKNDGAKERRQAAAIMVDSLSFKGRVYGAAKMLETGTAWKDLPPHFRIALQDFLALSKHVADGSLVEAALDMDGGDAILEESVEGFAERREKLLTTVPTASPKRQIEKAAQGGRPRKPNGQGRLAIRKARAEALGYKPKRGRPRKNFTVPSSRSDPVLQPTD